ncbi:hypothetical protein [Micromonospora sp. HM5-17]|uniref:hypothetical protein n=1 Tax=Micromonospora sp. HM5-17 TaxID=2487710 RepID=UPI0018F66DDF|nr:hypothetical protein [Micromonospora sp. HM5-17]
MADPHRDPSGNTEAFRAFAQSPEPVGASPSRLPLIVGIVVAVAVLVVLVGWLALG